MTVSTEISKTSYAGNGVTTAFATPIFLANTDIKVYLLDTITNTQTDWTLGSEYTLTGAGTGLAGTLTTTLGNTLSSDEEIYILRSTPLTQGTDYVEADSFPAKSHEAALDKLTFIAQEEKDALSRCVMVKETSNASLFKLSPEANTIIGFNDDATEFLNYSSLNLIPNSEASKYIKRNSANTAWEHLTPAEVLSDIGGINDTCLVKTTGDQTIGGVKTFSSSPIVPSPTTDYQAATKVYVDSVAGSGGFIGTCSTAAATAAKTVAITGFALATGVKVLVMFTNANTADTPTLNVESTGAKAIYTADGLAVSATNLFRVKAGETCNFYYDGTYWVVELTKSKVAEYAMPSDTYDTLTVGASGSTYTAPANGKYQIKGISSLQGGYGYFSNLTNGLENISQAHTDNVTISSYIEVKKGTVVTLSYGSFNISVCRFIYAQGEI